MIYFRPETAREIDFIPHFTIKCTVASNSFDVTIVGKVEKRLQYVFQATLYFFVI